MPDANVLCPCVPRFSGISSPSLDLVRYLVSVHTGSAHAGH
jgi:hypothetical protein